MYGECMDIEIPKVLKDSIEEGKLVVFVGAGLSVNCGLPNWKDLVINLLSNDSEYIDKNDDSVHHYLLDEIEQLLLLELKNIQDGKESDRDNAQRAAEITKEVENITNEMSQMQAGA